MTCLNVDRRWGGASYSLSQKMQTTIVMLTDVDGSLVFAFSWRGTWNPMGSGFSIDENKNCSSLNGEIPLR